MHLPIKMIRQSAIIIQPTQIRPAHVADLQFLMPRGPGGVAERFQLALFFLFGGFGDADFVVFGDCEGDAGGFAEDGDFEEACVDAVGEVGDLFELEEGGNVLASGPFERVKVGQVRTRSLVCLISSGVFSSRLCAASILRLHSSMYFCMSRM